MGSRWDLPQWAGLSGPMKIVGCVRQERSTCLISPTSGWVRALAVGCSRRFGFWAVGYALLADTAFSTAPSPLYGLYQQRDNLSSLTITVVYSVYAGQFVSLLLVGHISDWYGRRTVLIPALSVALLAAVLFCVWKSLPDSWSPGFSLVSHLVRP